MYVPGSTSSKPKAPVTSVTVELTAVPSEALSIIPIPEFVLSVVAVPVILAYLRVRSERPTTVVPALGTEMFVFSDVAYLDASALML